MDALDAPGEPGGAPGEPRRGPFAVESGESLVYRDTGDSPELRASAMYARVSPKVRVSVPPPQRRQPVEPSAWMPGQPVPATARVRRRPVSGAATAVRVVVIAVVTLVPLAAGWLLLHVGLATVGR